MQYTFLRFAYFFRPVYYRYLYYVPFIELSLALNILALASPGFFDLLSSFAIERKQ